MSESGGRLQLSGLFAASIVLVLVAFGTTLLKHVPERSAQRRPVVRGAPDLPICRIATIYASRLASSC